jgi:hypothetical protein
MNQNRIATIVNKQTGEKIPAEVRSYQDKELMVVLYRDFADGHLHMSKFIWKDESWISTDGVFESDYYFDKTMNDVTVKVSK